MCGIVGYVGTEQAAPILLAGLSKLEYRGYDSAGIAIRNEDTGDITVVKAKGRLKILSEKTNDGRAVPGTCGIGHTRWATHGEPSENNAHPHCTDDKSVVLVHNGIIENYQELKDKLIKSGYAFYSQTDTEIAVKLVDYYYRKTGTPLEAISRAMLRIRGSYAFGIMFHDHPGKIFAARKDSPLIIGKSQTGCLIASDVPAILDKTRNVYYIGNHEIAELSQDEVHFYNIDREEIQKEQVEIKWDAESAEKGGYEHFMLKEIHEQPRAVRDTIGAYVKDGKIDLSETGLTDEKLQEIERIYIVACGSAYHVGMVGKYVIEELADIPVEVDLASEFRYRNPKLVKNSLVVIVSQSGETADSLAALRLAKERKIPVLGIVNVVGSSIARESDYILYTYAGPEISVATTKAYSTQLIAMYLLAIQAAKVKDVIAEWDRMAAQMYHERVQIKPYVREVLEWMRQQGIHLGVATASYRTLFEPCLRRNGVFEYFEAVTETSEVERGKGFPDIYIKAAEKMNCLPEQCLVFEDITKGIEAARTGGFRTVAVYDPAAQAEWEENTKKADYHIVKFKELLEPSSFLNRL